MLVMKMQVYTWR